MATLEELVVRLKGDIADFQSKMQKAWGIASTYTSKISGSFKKVSSFIGGEASQINSFQAKIAGLAGAAGLVALTKSAFDTAGALNDLSTNTGLSTGFIQEMRYAAKLAGIEQEELNASFLKFSRNIGEAASGNKAFLDQFKQIGVSVRDANGNLKSNQELFLEVSQAIKESGSEAERNAISMSLFGKAGGKFGVLFSEGAAGIEKMRKNAQELGIVIDAELIKKADDAGDAFDTLNTVLTAKVNTTLLKLAPTIVSVSIKLLDLVGIAGAGFQGTLFEDTDAERIEAIKERLTELNAEIAKGPKQALWTQGAANIGRLEEIFEGMKLEVVALEAELSGLESKTKSTAEADKQASQAASEQAAATAKKILETKKLNEALEKRQKLEEDAAKIVGQATGQGKVALIEDELKTLQKAKEQKIGIEEETNKAILEKQNELHAAQREARQMEIESLLERNEQLREIDAAKFETEIEQNAARAEELSAIEEGMEQRKIESKGRLAQANEFFASQEMMTVQDGLTNLTALMQTKNKELFAIGKAAALANAVINTAQGVTKALAQGGILGPALAATVVAAGAVQIAAISAQKLATGIDEVPGVGTADNFPALLQPGERVVPKQTNKDLKAFLANDSKKSSQVVVNISIGTVLGSEESGMMIVDMLNNAIEKNGAKLLV
jgi:hypothetical protein